MRKQYLFLNIVIFYTSCILAFGSLARAEGYPSWVPDEAADAARRIWEHEINTTSLEMLNWKFGFRSREEGLACELKNPAQYVTVNYDQYIPGENIESYIEKSNDFEFAIYNSGKLCGDIRVKNIEGKWRKLSMGLSQGREIPDIVGQLYENVGDGDTRILWHECYIYFIEKKGKIESVQKWNHGEMDFLEREPEMHMATEKIRLERLKETPMHKQLEEMDKKSKKDSND